MDDALRELVRKRAANSCEYCQLRQSDQPAFALHIEHVIPRKHGGSDNEHNLALACRRCNFSKGPNLASVESETGDLIPLFNPRKDHWDEHFAFQGAEILGITATGRVTVSVLGMNDRERIRLRVQTGRFDANA